MIDYTTIEAGPECDRLVAEACDIFGHLGAGGALCYIDDMWCMFRPSTDCNDALLAAEKANLFVFRQNYHISLTNSGQEGWGVMEES